MQLHITVKPNQRSDRLWRDGTGLRAHIRAVPKDGGANAYLVKYLARILDVAPSLVTVVRGHTMPHKSVRVDAPEAELAAKLAQLPELTQLTLGGDA